MVAIALVTSFGDAAVEAMFRITSSVLYLVYGMFLVLAPKRVSAQIPAPARPRKPRTAPSGTIVQ